MGEMISFRGNGQDYTGYLARPSSGAGPGVIVIQEWWGLVGHIKEVADRFASAGFTALAPDFYKGEIALEPDEAGSLMMALKIDEAAKILNGAVDRLLEDSATAGDRVGVVGFCMGGQLALFAAGINPKIAACVDFYGIHPNVKPNFEAFSCPVLGFFAEHDDYANAAAVGQLRKSLEDAGKTCEFTIFEGTHHAFFNSDRVAVHHPEVSATCWKRMVEFFRAELV
jgi:carboxymethylenebutenolidase